MGRKKKKVAGAVVYFVDETATPIRKGEKLTKRLGPFLTLKEAEARVREEQEKMVPGIPQYEYEYSIEPVATEILRDSLIRNAK
jgi:hypothetical protein